MSTEPNRVPVTGTWYRHVRAGRNPLGLPPVGTQGRWQHTEVVGALYLANSAATAWAEFYRALAEDDIPPGCVMPRDLWSYRVSLDGVVDLGTSQALSRVGLPEVIPDRRQWPAYQAVGERLAARGAAGVLSPSAARPAHRVLCVFMTALDAVVALDRQRVESPPAPPRGLRT